MARNRHSARVSEGRSIPRELGPSPDEGSFAAARDLAHPAGFNDTSQKSVSLAQSQLRRSRYRTILTLLFGLVVLLLVFRSVQDFYFVSDTWGDLYMNRKSPLLYLTHDTYGGKLGRNYRPLWRLSGWVQHELSGKAIFSPRIYHFTSLGWHLLTSLGVFAILLLLTRNRGTALIGLLAFGLHPAVVEPVSWIAAESFLLSGMFGAWAVAAVIYAEFRPHPRRRRRILLAAGCVLGLASALSNEIGLGVLPFLCVLVWAGHPGESPSLPAFLVFLRTRRKFLYTALGLEVLYFAWRIFLFKGLTHWFPAPAPKPVTPLMNVANYMSNNLQYVLWDYTPAWLHSRIAMTDPILILLVWFGAIACLGYRALTRKTPVSVFLLGSVACCISGWTAYRLYPYHTDPIPYSVNGQRILYLSLAFAVVGVVAVIGNFLASASRPARTIALGLILFYLFGNLSLSRLNLVYWKESGQITRRFVQTLPSVLPSPPPGQTIYFVNPPYAVREERVPGAFTNAAYTMAVASNLMVQFAYRYDFPDKFVKVAKRSQVPKGAIAIGIDSDGTAKLLSH